MERLPERIEGDGLLLRRWTLADNEALGRAVEESAEHLRPWMPWAAAEPLPPSERWALLARWQADWEAGGDCVLGAFVEDEVAGSFGLHHRRGPETLEIGYWVHVDRLRQGVATRAVALLTEAAFIVPDITRVEIHHDKANLASSGVPRGLGFELIGEQPDKPEAPAEVGIDCIWRIERAADAGARPGS